VPSAVPLQRLFGGSEVKKAGGRVAVDVQAPPPRHQHHFELLHALAQLIKERHRES
jgi:hypothetical protein